MRARGGAPGGPAIREAGWLARDRLVRRAAQLLARRVVLIAAPWGSGKSTLLRHLAQRLDRPLLRIALDRDSVDLSYFLWQVAASLGYGADAMPGETETPQESVARLVARVAERPPLVIALDDAEEIAASAPVLEVVARFAEQLPRGSSLAIVSRTPLALPLDALRERDEVGVLGPEEFPVHGAELRELLAALAPEIALGPDDEDLVCAGTEGRILLARLFARAARRISVSDLLARMRREGGAEALVAAAIAELEPDAQRWLEAASILDRLVPEVIEPVTQAGAGAERWLAKARALHLVDPLERPERMPSLVRDVLRARLARDETRRRELHRRAAEAYRASGAADRVFHHLVEAHEIERAVETLIGIGHTTIHFRRLAALGRLLDELAPEVIAANPVLRFTRGSLRWVGERAAEALGDLRAAVADAERAGLADLARAARTRIAQIRTFQGGFAETIDVLGPVLAGEPDLGDPLVVSALANAVVAFSHVGRDAEAQAIRDRVAAGSVDEAALANFRLGECYAARLRGDAEQQRRLGLATLAEARRAGLSGVLCFMPTQVAEAELVRGDPARACTLAEEAEHASRTMRERWFELAAGEVRVRAERALGRDVAARALAHERIRGCAPLGADWTEAELWLSLATLPGEDPAHALDAAARAAVRTDHLELRARIALERARQAIGAGQLLLAREQVEHADAWLASLPHVATRVALELLRAQLARAEGNAHAARAAVREVGRRGGRFGAERAALLPELASEAVAGESWALDELRSAPRAALARLRSLRGKRVALLRSELLSAAARPCDVAALGRTEAKLHAAGDEPEESVAFRTPRVLDLLLFLLVEGRARPVSADALVEAFWSGTSADAGRRSLRTHLSYLRRALEPHAPAGESSHYVVREADGYRIDLRGGSFDAARMRGAAEEARRARNRRDFERAEREAERVLALYRGPFAANRPYVEAFDTERTQLALLYEEACLEGARLARERGERSLACERLEQMLAHEPAHGEAFELLIAWARADGQPAEVERLEARRRAALRELARGE